MAELVTDVAVLSNRGMPVVMDNRAPTGQRYRALAFGNRRTYNQAWFAKIYLDAISPDPVEELATEPLLAPLDGSRRYAMAVRDPEKAPAEGEAGPPDLRVISP